MADSTVVREDKIPGLSQTDCLTGKGSEDPYYYHCCSVVDGRTVTHPHSYWLRLHCSTWQWAPTLDEFIVQGVQGRSPRYASLPCFSSLLEFRILHSCMVHALCQRQGSIRKNTETFYKNDSGYAKTTIQRKISKNSFIGKL